ncbi:MAG: single-stranded DNA-binding protein [Deltaproteobacteria bacterium]|nr:single-stranded DNA-binding protein [Deltaproteobacteria bacterium]
MAQGLNKVILIGNLGTDPEVRYTQSNQAVAKFRLATTENFTDRNKNKQSRTEWHSIVAWGRTAETVGRFLRKGRQVYVEGRIQTRQWEGKDGNKRYTTEVVAQRVLFLGGRGDGDGPAPGGGAGGAGAPADEGSKASADEGFGDVMDPFSSDFESGGSASGGGGSSDDDDMPF